MQFANHSKINWLLEVFYEATPIDFGHSHTKIEEVVYLFEQIFLAGEKFW